MRVLLLGGTGNLGLRCIAALLAHHHTVVLYVRNIPKLRSLVSPAILKAVEAIVLGDATNSASIKQAILDHDIEGIIDVAGNQVYLWEELLLPKIAKAVADAAVAVGKERGRPLRIWLVTGVNVLKYPGTTYLLGDYFPKFATAAHRGTRDVIESIPISDLRWSLICVGIMVPANPKQVTFDLLNAPKPHNLLLKASYPPGWQNTWLLNIPWIGVTLNMAFIILTACTTKYEDVADLLAGDLASGSEEWIGMKVGMKDKVKMRTE